MITYQPRFDTSRISFEVYPSDDRLLIALGYQRHYKIGNPFEWMEMISLQGKTNFLEIALANTQNPG